MQQKEQSQKLSQFKEVDIPDGIISFLERKSGIIKSQKPNTYSVTEITECLRKSFYQKSNSKKKFANKFLSQENLWPTVRGDLLHQMNRAYKWNELDMSLEIPLEDGRIATVVGRLDMYDWRTKTIIDLKTTKDVYTQAEKKTIPRKDHILQIQCYGTIFSNVIPVKNLVLVYADLNDMIAFEVVNEDKIWWIKERIQQLDKSIRLRNPPKKEISKACNHCRYQNRCFPEVLSTKYEGSVLNIKKRTWRSQNDI